MDERKYPEWLTRSRVLSQEDCRCIYDLNEYYRLVLSPRNIQAEIIQAMSIIKYFYPDQSGSRLERHTVQLLGIPTLEGGQIEEEDVQNVIQILGVETMVAVVTTKQYDLSALIALAETPEQNVTHLVSAMDRELFRKHSYLSCESTGSLYSLHKYKPLRQYPGVYSLWKTRVDEKNELYIKGMIFVRNRKSMDYVQEMSQRYQIFQQIMDSHQFRTADTRYRNGVTESYSTLASMDITLPTKCSFDTFQNIKLDSLSPEPIRSSSAYFNSMMCTTHLPDFLSSRMNRPLIDWLFYKTENEQLVTPYYCKSIPLIEDIPKYAGAIVLGDPNSGKTTTMVKNILDQKKRCLYIHHEYDISLIKQLVQESNVESVMCMFQYEYSLVSKLDEFKYLFLEYQTLMNSSTIQTKLAGISFDVIVYDTLPNVHLSKRFLRIIHSIPCHRIQFICSSAMNMSLLKEILNLYRLSELAPEPFLTQLEYTHSYFLGLFVKNCIFYHCRHTQIRDIQLPQAYIFHRFPRFPQTQVLESLRQLLHRGGSISTHLTRFMAVMSRIDSSVPIREDEFLEFLESLKRVHTYPLIGAYPSLELKTVETPDEATCSICRSRFWDPVMNHACTHIFCYGCLKDWHRVQNTCPMCRTQFHTTFYAIHFQSSGRKRIRLSSDYYPHVIYNSDRMNLIKELPYSQHVTLVITNWKQMLKPYFDRFRQIPHCQPMIVHQTDEDLDTKSFNTFLIHVSNMMFYRNHPIITRSIFMDIGEKNESFQFFYRYFTHTERICLKSDLSLDSIRMEHRNNTRMTTRDLINEYYQTLSLNRSVDEDRSSDSE